MTITCRHVTEWICDFVSEELDDECTKHVRMHLVECTHCVAMIDSYRVTIKITRSLPPRPLPPSLQAKLEKVLEQINAQEM